MAQMSAPLQAIINWLVDDAGCDREALESLDPELILQEVAKAAGFDPEAEDEDGPVMDLDEDGPVMDLDNAEPTDRVPTIQASLRRPGDGLRPVFATRRMSTTGGGMPDAAFAKLRQASVIDFLAGR